MSGGDRNRKKVLQGQGWEEAGAEFYQESYPSLDNDFDVLQRDPKHLATLLPSKQTRAAATTVKRIRTTTDTKTFKRQTSSRTRRGSTTRRTSTIGEVQVSMLPDLSQNLSNEQKTWEEIMEIKALPVPMAQKREMKAKLQSEPNLRLQGFEQLKWKRRKMWQKFQAQIKESYANLELWKSNLKRIEGNCGTGVVTYFLFIKWLLYLNFGIFVIVFLFIILPMIIFKDEADDCKDCCSAVYFNQSIENSMVIDFVQGTGKIERTILFYGVYINKTFSYYINDTKLYYDLPLAYITVTIVYFGLSLIAIVKSAAKGFKERLVEGEGQFYQYCNLIFGGWDYCIHNNKTADIKNKAIYNEILGLLEVDKREETRLNRTRQENTKLFVIRFTVNLIVLIILGAAAATIYFVFNYSTNKINESPQSTILDSRTLKLIYEFLPSLSIVCLNILVPIFFTFLVKLEKYSPINNIRITLFRTVLLRLSSLLVLYASVYAKVSCPSDDVDTCLSADCTSCWETFVGKQIYKLFLTDFALQIFLTFFVDFPRALIAKKFKNKFVKVIGLQRFELPKHVLDIIYSQTLCWIGCFYAPLLPALATVSCFVMFYIKKFACLVNSTPGVNIYRASRSNSMFMIVLLVSYIFAIIPIAFAVSELYPSRSCGPFRGLSSVWSYLVDIFNSAPSWLRSFLFFVTTAGFGIPAFVLLVLLLYYYWAVNSANRHMVVVLKNQLVLEGHDKQFLLDRLSIFIKQQQESQKKLRHVEMMRDSDRNVSSN